MKALKIYLVVVTVLLVVALGFGVYVWMTILKLQNVTGGVESTPVEMPVEVKTEPTEKAGTTTVTPVVETKKEPVTIEVDKLSDTQQEILKTFGVKSNTLTITPAMIQCAEAKLGAPRVAEITNGAAPSPLEAFSLAGCFK